MLANSGACAYVNTRPPDRRLCASVSPSLPLLRCFVSGFSLSSISPCGYGVKIYSLATGHSSFSHLFQVSPISCASVSDCCLAGVGAPPCVSPPLVGLACLGKVTIRMTDDGDWHSSHSPHTCPPDERLFSCENGTLTRECFLATRSEYDASECVLQ